MHDPACNSSPGALPLDLYTMGKTAPQLTQEELSHIRQWQGSPLELWKMHKDDRKARRVKPLCVTAFRNAPLDGP